MKEERDYYQDLSEIRSMMERSSKFLSLSGLSGIMAGIFALAGAGVASSVYSFNPDEIAYSIPSGLPQLISLALLVLLLALGTAMVLSYKKGKRSGESVWNATSRRLLVNMAVPLSAGGILILVLLAKGLIGLIAPLMLLFYGLAIYNASKFTYDEMKFMGLIQMGLGLLAAWHIEYSLLLWAIGFGVVHIVYGSYMHLRYER